MEEVSTCRLHLITYLEVDEILEILNTKDAYIKEALIINHDLDENENHRHIVINLNRSRTIEQVVNWFKKDERNTFGRKNTYSRKSTIEYLLHINESSVEDGKHQYSARDIIAYKCDITEWLNEDKDNSYFILTSVIENVPYLELARKFGKDFIYHYRNYIELANCIKAQNSGVVVPPNEPLPKPH